MVDKVRIQNRTGTNKKRLFLSKTAGGSCILRHNYGEYIEHTILFLIGIGLKLFHCFMHIVNVYC